MKKALNTYRIELTTISPLFIGDGKSMKKKEYVRKGSTIYVPDIYKLYRELSKKGLRYAYEDYLLNNYREDLGTWLMNNKMAATGKEDWINYKLDTGDISLDRKGQVELLSFVKDSYGLPYVPGSSLKGVIRTILLAYILKNNSSKYTKDQNEIYNEAKFSRDKRNKLLQKHTRGLEVKAFHSLGRLNKNPKDVGNAVNDIMSCIRISDSRPLKVADLIACQKLDMSKTGTCKSLNITRECIRPGTKIIFDLTIDEQFPFDINDIRNAIEMFSSQYVECFYKHFAGKIKDLKQPKKDYIWLGGGVGYVSKTVIYPLLGRKQGLEATANIMCKTVNNRDHHHEDDISKGVSPHMLKCTKYKGKLYEFGQCQIKIS